MTVSWLLLGSRVHVLAARLLSSIGRSLAWSEAALFTLGATEPLTTVPMLHDSDRSRTVIDETLHRVSRYRD